MAYLSRKDLIAELVKLGHKEKALNSKKRPDLAVMLAEETEKQEAELAVDQLGKLKEAESKEVLENLSEASAQEVMEESPEPQQKIEEEQEGKDGEIEVDLLDQLTAKEVYIADDGTKYPKVHGLRRLIIEKHEGIFSESPVVVQTPSAENGYIAVVTYIAVLGDGQQIAGCADATRENCQGVYATYLTAMAETRAQGRAYRIKLNISAPSFEEMGDKKEVSAILTADPSQDGLIIPTQIQAIDAIAKRVGVNVSVCLEKLGKKEGGIGSLTSDEAIQLIKELQTYEAAGEIPEELMVQEDNNVKE